MLCGSFRAGVCVTYPLINAVRSSRETNVADAIRREGLYEGIPPVDLAKYVAKGRAVCASMGIKVSRGTPYPDPSEFALARSGRSGSELNSALPALILSLGKPSGMRTIPPVHDAADEDAAAIASGHLQNTATPPLPVPKRVADGMPLVPTKAYLAQVDIPSRAIAPDGRPRLVIFDLDGTVSVLEQDRLNGLTRCRGSCTTVRRSIWSTLLLASRPVVRTFAQY